MTLPVLLLVSLAHPAEAQCPPAESPLANATRVELRGVIRKVELAGRRMPAIELETSGGMRRIVLGSIRYLVERNFNPKAGTLAVVQAFEYQGLLFARRVELPALHESVELRDQRGVPLWRGRWSGNCIQQ